MQNHDRLSNLILEHWSRYHPSMLAQLKREGRLEREVEKTAQAFADHLHALIAVEKLAYHQAWELTVDRFLLPEETTPAKTKPNPRATSG
jgi:hypothetical protein